MRLSAPAAVLVSAKRARAQARSAATHVATLALGAAFAVAAVARPTAQVGAAWAQGGAIAIRDVTVISATGAAPVEHATVVVRGERIVYVGPNATAPAAERVVEGAGKFVIPGLIEMHAHLSKTRASALGWFVANGVTTVRDMGGDHEELLRWRDDVRAGRRVGPGMLIAGPYLESARNVQRMRKTPAAEMAEPVERTRVPVGSPAEAERVIARLAGRVDHIKIRTVQNRETYLAIGKAAHKHGLPLVGHVYGIAPEDILLSGQRSIEHQVYPTLDNLTVDARMTLWTRFAAAGVGIVPTFVTITRSVFPDNAELQAMVNDDAGVREPRRRYVSKYLLIDWREQVSELTADRRAQFQPIYDSSVRNVREMRQAGMRIMAGSDVAVLNVFPGSSLHEELAIFVKTIGMTPMEALQSATSRPAEFIGRGTQIGTVETGKIADLVLLDANPLDDIGNVSRIQAVLLRGRLFDRAGLDQLLAAVEAAPDRRVNDWPRRASH